MHCYRESKLHGYHIGAYPRPFFLPPLPNPLPLFLSHSCRHWYIQIWHMVKRSQRYVGFGYTSQTWLDRHFLYSYHVWINHHTQSHNETRRYLPPANTYSKCPGVIGNTFYRSVTMVLSVSFISGSLIVCLCGMDVIRERLLNPPRTPC